MDLTKEEKGEEEEEEEKGPKQNQSKTVDSTLFFRKKDDTKIPDSSSKQLFKDKTHESQGINFPVFISINKRVTKKCNVWISISNYFFVAAVSSSRW